MRTWKNLVNNIVGSSILPRRGATPKEVASLVIGIHMRLFRFAMFSAMVFIALAACNRRQEVPPAAQTRVSATKAFEKYFGPAPTTDKGTCFAFAIFFSSTKEPGKVIPFPFFTFDEATLKRVAVQRLLTGMADIKSYQGEILQPFPPGTRLLDLSDKAGVVTVNFSKEVSGIAPGSVLGTALANAVALTLKQFDGVTTVKVLVEGKDSGFNKYLQAADESAVQKLCPPRLLGVTAMRERGAAKVEEVDAFFDRPVDIKSLAIASADGTPYQGVIYQSVFDMAGVLKLKEPATFTPGMPIKVTWQVTDKLGSTAEGTSVVPLEVKEH